MGNRSANVTHKFDMLDEFIVAVSYSKLHKNAFGVLPPEPLTKFGM